jgi:hypothetical protein
MVSGSRSAARLLVTVRQATGTPHEQFRLCGLSIFCCRQHGFYSWRLDVSNKYLTLVGKRIHYPGAKIHDLADDCQAVSGCGCGG